MTKEEKHIEELAGRNNPFTVPEGYFAELQANLMKNIPSAETKVVKMRPRRRFLMPVIGAAASVCVAVIGATVYFQHDDHLADQQTAQHVVPVLSDDKEFCEMLGDEAAEDYIMMSTGGMYKYIAENY